MADKIYRNRKTLSFCKLKGIRITGPALGRPKKDDNVSKETKREEYKDIYDRNAVEGAFGTCKTRYGMGRIKACIENTSMTVIAMSLLCMNLFKMLERAFFALFLTPIKKAMLMLFLDIFEAVAQPQKS